MFRFKKKKKLKNANYVQPVIFYIFMYFKTSSLSLFCPNLEEVCATDNQ